MKKIKLLFVSTLLINPITLLAQLVPINWVVTTVKDPQQSAGFLDVKDLDGDGTMEILLSTLIEGGGAQSPWDAQGAIRVFKSANGTVTGTWNEQVVLPLSENLPFINDPQVFDVDEDGHLDIIVNQGFIRTNGGSHQWIKGPDFTDRFNFSPQTTHGDNWYVWHESQQVDLDGDGKMDIITTSAQTQDASNNNNNALSSVNAKIEWYRHLGDGDFEHYVINDTLGGVFIKLHDIDNDGDLDIVVSQFFWGTDRPALVWLENVVAPAASNNYQGEWEYHVIDNTTGLGYYFEFYDIDMDGKMDLVYDNHNNQNNNSINYNGGPTVMPGLYYFKVPANPATSSQWEKVTIYEGFRSNLFDFGNPDSQGCPGIFSIGDLDGNGYPDIACPGDGNDTLYLFRQLPDNSFQMEVIDRGKMFGMTKVVDIDGDGKLEIVAAKHNFPEVWQLLNPPAGFLKIYQLGLNCGAYTGPLPVILQDNDALSTDMIGVSYQWYLNGQEIAGENESTYTPTVSGDYTVSVNIAHDCDINSLPTSVDLEGGNTASLTVIENEVYHLYPNPTSGKITIQGKDSFELIQLYAVTGQLMLTLSNTNEVDLTSLPNGIYYARIGSVTTKVVKR